MINLNHLTWTKQAPCGTWHRLFHWTELERNVGNSCQGDWLTIEFTCTKCRVRFIGQSELGAYCILDNMEPKLTFWALLDGEQYGT